LRVALAYLGSVVLLVLGGIWAWSFLRPLREMPVVATSAAVPVLSILVLGGMVCGLVCGAVLSLLARPRQLQHASIIAAMVAVISFVVNATPGPWQSSDSPALAIESLYVLPFIVTMLACTGITRAKALERQAQYQEP
jgi:hypothetical protein